MHRKKYLNLYLLIIQIGKGVPFFKQNFEQIPFKQENIYFVINFIPVVPPGKLLATKNPNANSFIDY
jgi:hypothetical protein